MTFRDAYIKLTAFYVVIIMAISLIFSIWVYNEATRELERGLGAKIEQIGVQNIRTMSLEQFMEDQLQQARMRIVFNLFTLNVIVLVVGAGTSYLLARRTMRPIEEAVEAKDRFTADASHELRTPLAAMKAEIEVYLRDTKHTKAETDALLHSNLEEIDRMGSLAEGLLVLTNEDRVANYEEVAIDNLLKTTCQRFTRLAQAKAITITCEVEPLTMHTEPAHLEKIISILLDNALKYSPDDSAIAVTLSHNAGMMEITVTDQGYGIKASDLPHIFERFYRADASRSKERVVGHGLGLSIAQKLATSLGGRLTAASTIGKGSSFTLSLPL